MDSTSSSEPALKGFRTTVPESSPLPAVNHLLVIAIDDYQHAPRLNNCVRDARGLIDLLHGRYAFAPEHITTLFDEEATGENIIRHLEALPEKLQATDNLLIFFSGHGEYRQPQEEGFWVPVDARRGITKDRISVPELRMYLNPLPCRHLVLIVDACFSGSLFQRYRSSGEDLNPTLSEPSRWGLTSGRLEPVLDGRPGMHSPFAESLLKQLKANTEALRIDQLHGRIVADLERLGFQEQAPDCGYLDLSGNRRGMFVLEPRQESKPAEQQEDFELQIDQTILRIIYGDIVDAPADVVVSSDDNRLTMGGGVSASIARAAGPGLRAFVRDHLPQDVKIGDVVETAAFDLPSNYIFHCITIDYATRTYADDATIAAMTRRCLELADERALRHIVFPAIGTGAAGASFESTAQAMINAVCAYLIRGSELETVTITLYHRKDKPLSISQQGMKAFFQKAVRQGAAWSRLEQSLEALPELLQILGKEQWTEEALALGRKILGKEES